MKKQHKANLAQTVLIIALIVSQMITIGYFYRENKQLKDTYTKEATKRMETDKKLEDLRAATEGFYLEFQDVGGLTAEGFTATLKRIDDFMVIHDGNVEIYNSQIKDLYDKMTIIADVLENQDARLRKVE